MACYTAWHYGAFIKGQNLFLLLAWLIYAIYIAVEMTLHLKWLAVNSSHAFFYIGRMFKLLSDICFVVFLNIVFKLKTLLIYMDRVNDTEDKI